MCAPRFVFARTRPPTADLQSEYLIYVFLPYIGAIEYQELHRDGIYAEPYDPQGKLTLLDYPTQNQETASQSSASTGFHLVSMPVPETVPVPQDDAL